MPVGFDLLANSGFGEAPGQEGCAALRGLVLPGRGGGTKPYLVHMLKGFNPKKPAPVVLAL